MNSKVCQCDLELSISARNYESWVLDSATHMYEHMLTYTHIQVLFIYEGDSEDHNQISDIKLLWKVKM